MMFRPHQRQLELALLLFLACLSSIHAVSFTLKVSNNEEECFVLRTTQEKTMLNVDWEVMDDNLSPDPLAVVVLDMKLKVLYKSLSGDYEDDWSGSVDKGRYSICVQNGMGMTKSADRLDREVGIDIWLEPYDPTSHLLSQAWQAWSKLRRMQSHQSYMRQREASHRDVTERTFASVMTYTIVEAIALTLISVLQILFIRRFLEKRRYM